MRFAKCLTSMNWVCADSGVSQHGIRRAIPGLAIKRCRKNSMNGCGASGSSWKKNTETFKNVTIDYEEARRVVARALASGAISVATAPTPARKKRALEAKPRKRVVREKRMCPRCERMVLAVNGRVIKHREREDRRSEEHTSELQSR